jgi:group I intron endonuclease
MNNKKENYTVYMHISPSGKKYVGITKQEVTHRWGKSGSRYAGCKRFFGAIQKYGFENIEHRILFTGLSKKEAEEKEIALIKEYKTTDPKYGYNIENGGNTLGSHSEETKKKIGEKSKGNKACVGRRITQEHIEALRDGRRKNGYRGHAASEETKKKISDALKDRKLSEEHKRHISQSCRDMSGENNPMYGRKHSDETRLKISTQMSGRKLSEERKQQMSEAAHKRAVLQIDANGNVVGRFNSVKEAACFIGAKSQNLGFCCRNAGHYCKGYLWKYENDHS